MEFLYKLFAGVLIELYKMLGSFGLSIIGITILVKLVTLPLTLKQDKSMRAMKELQPELDKLKEKHKDDSKALNQATMELYQAKKINPASGCLPLLIQMPILFALFGVLRIDTVAQVYKYMPEIPVKEAFLWLSLEKPDPYFILPVLNGIVSFVQQKLTGSGDNPQMKQMMYMFPIMMIFISYKMPAGLQVYWVVSSLAGIIQQYWIMQKGAKKN